MKCTVIRVNAASFDTAVGKVRSLLALPGEKEITLSFASGNYFVIEPVSLCEGNAPAHLRLIAGGRQKTVFSSLRELPAERFSMVEGKPYAVCQLEKSEDGTYPNLRAFYVNNEIAAVSRTKEYRSASPFKRADGTEYALSQANWNDDHRIYVPAEAVEEAGVENCRGAELHIRVEWEFKIYHIDYIDTEDTYTDDAGRRFVAMQLCRDEHKNGNRILRVTDRVFFICNTTSVLTTPGQYAYERAAGKLYYYPKTALSDCTFALGTATALFSFENFTELTLRGMTFTGIEDTILTETGFYAADQAGSWGSVFADIFPQAGAVKIRGCGRADIDGCVFTDLPCDAVSMVGVLNHVTVEHCRFVNIGATALRIGRPVPYDENNQINDLTIADNFLDNIGFTYENSCSIIATKVRVGRILHNTILRSSYTAVSLGWKWDKAPWSYGEQVNLESVEVAYNYIKSFVTNMRDGGGIYTLGGNTEVHEHAAFINSVHDNVVIEDKYTCPENGFFASLYHDGASSNWHTFNNIVVHNPALNGPSGRIYLQNCWYPDKPFTASTGQQSSWHILSENNYICGCKNFGEVYRSQQYDPEKASDMLDYTRDLHEKDTHLLKNAKELQKYPEAVRILSFSGCDEALGKKR